MTTLTCSVSNELTTAEIAPATNPNLPASPQTNWDGGLVVIQAGSSSDADGKIGYELTLAGVPLASQAASLALGAKDSISLDPGTGATLTSLFFAQSNNLFPVSSIGIAMGRSVSSITVDNTSKEFPEQPALPATVAALQFIQQIQTDPTSDMASNFNAALTESAKSDGSSPDISTRIGNFFTSNTKGFHDATYSAYELVQTYLKVMPFACAGFSSQQVYYLYSKDPNGGYDASFIGIIVLQSDGSAPSVSGGPNFGYKIIYSDEPTATRLIADAAVGIATKIDISPDLTTKELTWSSDGQVVSDSTDSPSIALQFTYTQKSAVTTEPTDSQTVLPALLGKVNGVDVLGIPFKATLGSRLKADLNDFLNSSGIQEFIMFMNLVQALETAFKGVSWLKKKLAERQAANPKNAKPSAEQVADARAEAEKVQADALSESQSSLRKVAGDDAVSFPSYESGRQEAARNRVLTEEKNSVEHEVDLVENASASGTNPTVEKAEGELQAELDTANKMTLQDKNFDLETTAVATQVKATTGKFDSDLTALEKATAEKEVSVQKDLIDEYEEINASESKENGGDPEEPGTEKKPTVLDKVESVGEDVGKV